MIPALSLHQPYASLAVHGIKRWETRPNPPAGGEWCVPAGVRRLPGARLEPGGALAIHATAKAPKERTVIGDWMVVQLMSGAWALEYQGYESPAAANDLIPLPLGAIVGSVIVTDMLPIETPDSEIARAGRMVWTSGARDLKIARYTPAEAHPWVDADDISDQLPYGDWRSGRWAWKLAKPRTPEQRCPACWGSGDDTSRLVGLCGRTDDGSDGPCAMRGGHSGPCWGEDDVAGDWTPAMYAHCPVCNGAEWCGPIPMRGAQGVWRWTP